MKPGPASPTPPASGGARDRARAGPGAVLPVAAPVASRPAFRVGRRRADARIGTASLLLGAVAVAAAMAALLALWLGEGALWIAPLAATLGVLVAAVPVGLLLHRLSHDAGAGAAAAVPSGMQPAGVPRSLFMDLSAREWSRARRYGTGAALLLVDVDGFAHLLESRAGPAGDAVLNAMLRVTAPTLRGADLLTRYGSSQMAVFLAQADATGALDVAERIRERCEQLEPPIGGRSQRVTVSVGVAHLRPAHLQLAALIADAEDALGAARLAGGNCVRAAPVEPASPTSGSWRGDRRTQPK